MRYGEVLVAKKTVEPAVSSQLFVGPWLLQAGDAVSSLVVFAAIIIIIIIIIIWIINKRRVPV